VDIVVELVAKSGECIVQVLDGERTWSTGFDLLSGNVDDLVLDLEGRMNQEVEGESPMMSLLQLRVAQARSKLRREMMK